MSYHSHKKWCYSTKSWVTATSAIKIVIAADILDEYHMNSDKNICMYGIWLEMLLLATDFSAKHRGSKKYLYVSRKIHQAG